MQIIDRDKYYIGLAYYLIGCQKQEEVRKHEKFILDLFDKSNIVESLSDSIYSGGGGSKEEYDKLLLDNGITVQWKPPKKIIEKNTDATTEENKS
jgi:hypothetical protein